MLEKAMRKLIEAYESKLLEFMDPGTFHDWSNKIKTDIYMETVEDISVNLLKKINLEKLEDIPRETNN